MRRLSLLATAILVAGLCSAASAGVVKGAQGNNGNGGNSDSELVPTGKGWGERPANFQGNNGNGGANGQAGRNKTSNGINYHGGPLITAGPSIYYIWYGNWSGNIATTILEDLAHNIGGSPYFAINTTYSDGSNSFVKNVATFNGSTTDGYSHGTSLTDSAVQAIVQDALASGRLPTDPNGVYFVLTSSDVNETSGFCTQYCGWHTHGSLNLGGKTVNVRYSFVGNPDRCPSACAAQTTSPNGNVGADGMASIIAHELEEATTDPDLNAWFDVRGQENADKCAWTFGTTYAAAGGGKANMKLGTRDYLIQQNWVNATGGYCAISYTSP